MKYISSIFGMFCGGTVETRCIASLRVYHHKTWFLIIIVLGFTSMFPVIAQPPANDREALERYIQIGLENNPGLRAASLDAESARLDAPQFGRLPDPMIEIEYEAWSRDNMNRFSLMLKQPFPWFGTLETNRKYFNRLADISQTSLRKSRNELIRDIRILWFEMHEIYHHIFALNENLKLLESIERQMLTQLESGRGSQVELIRIEIEREKLKNLIERNDDMLASQKYRFNALLNRKPDADITLFYFTEAMEAPTEYKPDHNPDMEELQIRLEAAELDRRRAWLEGFPDFSIGLGMMSRDAGFYDPDRINAVMIKLDIGLPIYRGRNRARQQQARINALNTVEQRMETANRLEADFRQQQRLLDTAVRDSELYSERLIPAVRRALDIALEYYGSGRTSFEEIIQLQRQLLELEMSFYEAETARGKATANLDYLSGNPVQNGN